MMFQPVAVPETVFLLKASDRSARPMVVAAPPHASTVLETQVPEARKVRPLTSDGLLIWRSLQTMQEFA